MISAMDRELPQRRFAHRHWRAIALILICTIAVMYGYQQFGKARDLSVQRQSLSISSVSVGVFDDYVPISGNVEPRNTVYLDAIEGGQVLEVLVEEGATVAAGQPLMRLKNANLQLQVLNSEAQLSEQLNRLMSTRIVFAQSRLSHERDEVETTTQRQAAALRLGRMKAAGLASGAVRRADIEDAELELTRLLRLEAAAVRGRVVDEQLQKEEIVRVDHTIRAMTENLEIAHSNLENLVITAPITGQLTSLEAHVGESKSAGQRVGQLDEIDRYKVEALVDEHYLPRVTLGQQATASIGEREYVLRVKKIYSEVRERQFKVDLDFADAPPSSLRRGLSLQIRLAIGAPTKSLVLANGPFYEDTGGEWAFVFDNPGPQAKRRKVRFGRHTAETIEVLDGLRAGDRVITSSYETLKGFQRIRVLDRN